MNEKPGCRCCREVYVHLANCELDKSAGMGSPVLDSERKDFGRMAQATAESLGRTEYDPRAYDPNCYYCRNGWCHDHEKGPGRMYNPTISQESLDAEYTQPRTERRQIDYWREDHYAD